MKVLRKLEVPTGHILVVEGSRRGLPLELVSLGDYGQAVNLNQRKRVDHCDLMPLTEKWVVTISTQYGCSMGCSFCDVPRVGPGHNASFHDMVGQVITGLHVHPEITSSKRLNVHFARMGEPSWNPAVLDAAKWIHTHLGAEWHPHPVVSTMMPRRNEWLKVFIHNWMRIKNRLYNGNAGLQLSINSTDEDERLEMFNGNSLSLVEISGIMDGVYPVGRKVTLNFAVAGYKVDPEYLARLFSPELYIVKLTPMHDTLSARTSATSTPGDPTSPEPYMELEANLKRSGFEVLVFIASKEEDEGLITCGNAILSGALPRCKYIEREV